MKLHISPCPNDTFTFHAMIHALVDTEGLVFEPVFDDIDVLNGAAVRRPQDEEVIKISYAALPEAAGHFRLLESGSALGHGNGPLLVSRHKIYPDELYDVLIGIPGELTTANRLLSIVFPGAKRKRVYLFSEIAGAVADGELDAGVLIHEGRFTYASRGLKLVADLGREWEMLTGLPIPLGGILLNRKYSSETADRVGRIIRRSIEYAQGYPEASAAYVQAHAQELDPVVRRKHISYFVNDYSLSLGAEGRRAVERLTGLPIEQVF
ncbi:1,4-dihydroxy-6-naphthoate synthase [uncultured Rikenella sp.]|uniref:1,4-dihydroxy-6-naphthoate synthase n=1 Tax=uncultured Rikenella sp. TaxID=368003 RepID=UPI0026073438|nr:1,4-dihydroxy-6-naphthoate synthase [uncultured Rikenella sp.]